ncbi:MAG: hypothetical protein IPN76_17815 [Saprospiraceae bacterium]|nr:hypothetical protein [Saprospiraceae bacterium]
MKDPVQLIPVTCTYPSDKMTVNNYFLINPLCFIDAIDLSESKIKYSGSLIASIDLLHLDNNIIKGHDFFRLKKDVTLVVVSEGLVRKFTEAGTVGINFIPVEEFKI